MREIFFLAVVAFLSVDNANARDREISVSGNCSRQVTTDRAAVIVTADALDKDLKSAIKKATREYERTLEAVKKLRLEEADLQTVEYSVVEDKEWENKKMVSKGFRARIGLRVSSSDVQRLGEVTEIAAREEIKDVGNLATYLSDEKLRRETEACLKDAAENARSKADKLAHALGAKLGKVVNLQEGNITVPSPVPMMRANFKAADQNEAAAPSIQAGRQDVGATVQVSFALE